MNLLRPRILIAESRGFSARAAATLNGEGEVVMADLKYDELLSEIATANVLWIRLRNRIDALLLKAAPSLRFIATATTGLNHIDLEEAQRRGIAVVSLKGEREFLKDVRATAELTIALLLALMRQIPAARASVLEERWERDAFLGHELYGMTAGIVGFGRLGRIVARYLRAFDMTVLASDPRVTEVDMPPDVRLASMEQLLRASDVVTMHVDLSPETHGFFGPGHFAMMKKGSWFINTSRGELIDETALIHALQTGHLSGAALDVVSGEHAGSMGEHSLIRCARTHPNLLITPHIGGYTRQSLEKAECFLAEKLVARMRASRAALESGTELIALYAFSIASELSECCL